MGVSIQKTEQSLAEIINGAGLPASVLLLILKDLYNQVAVVAQKEMVKEQAPQEPIDLGEGIQERTTDTYDYDGNYTPQRCDK